MTTESDNDGTPEGVAHDLFTAISRVQAPTQRRDIPPLLVVNLFGPPGSGKSTLAMMVGATLKSQYPDLVTECPDEVAKHLVFEGATKAIACQLHVCGMQYWQIARCEGMADIVVCDSPILLSSVYAEENMGSDFPQGAFFDVCVHHHRRHASHNYLVERTHAFDPRGRVHAETDETRILNRIESVLSRAGVCALPAKSFWEHAERIAESAADFARQLKAEHEQD